MPQYVTVDELANTVREGRRKENHYQACQGPGRRSIAQLF